VRGVFVERVDFVQKGTHTYNLKGIMTSRPYYGRFELDFGLKAGLKIVAADTPLETCLQPDVVNVFEKTLQKAAAEGIEVRALLIINPHNPLGR
jgi:1-aminocyclopropane-1-carboxylate synthase